MKPKFNNFQFVLVDGTATGYGDLLGWIMNIEISEILKEPHYQIRVDSDYTDRVYVAERFLSENSEALFLNKHNPNLINAN